MTKVTRADWKDLQPAKALREVSCCFAFSEEEHQLISDGYSPESFDNHWFIIEEGGRLLFYRTWTGALAYAADLTRTGEQWAVRTIRATTDRDIYEAPEKDLDVAADVWSIINCFLLKRYSKEDFSAIAATLPQPAGESSGPARRFEEQTAYFLARARLCEKMRFRKGGIEWAP